MPAFSYQALDGSGRKVKGVLEGDSERNIRSQLREKKLKPIAVAAAKEGSETSTRSAGGSNRKIRFAELVLLTRHLATLIQSNLPIDESLRAAAKQSRRPKVEGLLLDVRSRVTEGHSLAYALADYPAVFNDMYRAMVKAGEHSGFLGVVLERLADYTEARQYTQQKLKMAMVYPIIVVLVAFAVVGGLMVYVVPDLIRIFQSSQAELPTLTKILIACSDYLSEWGGLTLLVIGALAVGARLALRNPEILRSWHAVQLKMPLVGELVRNAESARFASTLNILIASSVPLLDAMRIAAEVLHNRILRESVEAAAVQVQEGMSLHKALEKTDQFPPMMVHMIASGELSGELEAMLGRAALNQERELEMTANAMMSILEPVMIVVMGVVVLLIVLAILMPIFSLNNLVA
ncbi:MAG: type II secretion system inner membrane protein GspF [Pseudomonadota bacterium]